MKKIIICAALLIIVGCLAASPSNAQQIYLFSESLCQQGDVDCESSIGVINGTVLGYSSTEVDYWASL